MRSNCEACRAIPRFSSNPINISKETNMVFYLSCIILATRFRNKQENKVISIDFNDVAFTLWRNSVTSFSRSIVEIISKSTSSQSSTEKGTKCIA